MKLCSHKLPRRYLRDLREAGVQCEPFGTNRHWWSRLQVNFRNHRKIIVIDGRIAFLGGLNVGDEYLGRDVRFGALRDTISNSKARPSRPCRWCFWKIGSGPPASELRWNTYPETADQVAAIIPTGPADPAGIMAVVSRRGREFLAPAAVDRLAVFRARRGVPTALQAAALRGADVRILIPERADHLLVWLSAFTCTTSNRFPSE